MYNCTDTPLSHDFCIEIFFCISFPPTPNNHIWLPLNNPPEYLRMADGNYWRAFLTNGLWKSEKNNKKIGPWLPRVTPFVSAWLACRPSPPLPLSSHRGFSFLPSASQLMITVSGFRVFALLHAGKLCEVCWEWYFFCGPASWGSNVEVPPTSAPPRPEPPPLSWVHKQQVPLSSLVSLDCHRGRLGSTGGGGGGSGISSASFHQFPRTDTQEVSGQPSLQIYRWDEGLPQNSHQADVYFPPPT